MIQERFSYFNSICMDDLIKELKHEFENLSSEDLQKTCVTDNIKKPIGITLEQLHRNIVELENYIENYNERTTR